MKSKLYENKELIVAIVVVIIFLMTCSFAWLVIKKGGDKTNILRAGNLELKLDDEASSGILLKEAIPVSDEKGLTTDAYTFTLKNTGPTALYYTIYLDDVALEVGETRMLDKYVKYSLTKNANENVLALLTSIGENPNRIIDTGIIEGNNTINTYDLRVWIDQDADTGVMGTIFLAELRVEATQSQNSST